MLKLDHIAIAAETLEAGRAHVEQTLGVPLQPGGQHARYGTHNALLGLQDGLYLEVITTDPDAPAPDTPRWFDLDRFSGPPRLANWICAVEDLEAALRQLPEAGEIVTLERGDLRWRMAVPADGVLSFDNLFPALIEWQAGGHPSERLQPSGCRLTRLTLRHPQARALHQILAPWLTAPVVTFEMADTPGMLAEFDTPSGPGVLF